MNRSKNLKNTSVNIPFDIFERIDSFASSVGLNRNAAMIYLLSRGLEYESDFSCYIEKRKKKKDDVTASSVEKSARRRPHHDAYEVKDLPWRR